MSPSSKRILTIIVILVVVILLAMPKLKGLWSKEEKPAAGAPGGTAPAMMVSAIVMENDTMSNDIIVAGNVLPYEQVELRTEVSGRVVNVNFKEGSKVSKGQLLLKLNDADLVAQLRKFQSELSVVEAR